MNECAPRNVPPTTAKVLTPPAPHHKNDTNIHQGAMLEREVAGGGGGGGRDDDCRMYALTHTIHQNANLARLFHAAHTPRSNPWNAQNHE